MRDYRLYRLDGARRIQHAADVIQAESDDDALAQVRALKLPTACEIWQGRQMVATVPAVT